MTRTLKYLTVSTDNDAEEYVGKLMAALQDGFEIISAAGNGYAVHYVLEKK